MDNQFSGKLRRIVREALRRREYAWSDIEDNFLALQSFVEACSEVGFGLIAVTTSGFPLFLTPISELPLSHFQNGINVRIRWNAEGWYLDDPNGSAFFPLMYH